MLKVPPTHRLCVAIKPETLAYLKARKKPYAESIRDGLTLLFQADVSRHLPHPAKGRGKRKYAEFSEHPALAAVKVRP